VQVRREVVQVPRILVADDNTNIQKMVVLAFEERGVDVVAVGNGEAAVRRMPDANPDLVLADVFMPVRNGYEVCEFVKKDSRFAHIPVILLVGAFDPLDEKEARRVGADGVLKKPFVPPDPLIAMVMSALEKNPKVAAELAKARETPPEPPPPVMEIPAKAEPKPLPDFPEPSPEEAAAIYGFGKGVRAVGDEPESADAKRPKAPVAKAKDSDEDEDDFDEADTATDWRRTGGVDFDIPENTAVDPAYSYGKDLAPITFPSEKEVPPKRIHVRDDELDNEPVAPLAPLGQQLASKPAEPSAADQEEERRPVGARADPGRRRGAVRGVRLRRHPDVEDRRPGGCAEGPRALLLPAQARPAHRARGQRAHRRDRGVPHDTRVASTQESGHDRYARDDRRDRRGTHGRRHRRQSVRSRRALERDCEKRHPGRSARSREWRRWVTRDRRTGVEGRAQSAEGRRKADGGSTSAVCPLPSALSPKATPTGLLPHRVKEAARACRGAAVGGAPRVSRTSRTCNRRACRRR